MLDPWIIDQIRRREEERHRREDRPVIEPPGYPSDPLGREGYEEDRAPTDGERGVVIIDYGI